MYMHLHAYIHTYMHTYIHTYILIYAHTHFLEGLHAICEAALISEKTSSFKGISKGPLFLAPGSEARVRVSRGVCHGFIGMLNLGPVLGDYFGP